MEVPPSPPVNRFKHYLPDALLLLLLLVLTFKFDYQINTIRDLKTDDETSYLAHGHFLPKWGLPPAAYSPLYVLWYNGWDHLHLDPIFVYFANWGLLSFLLAAGQYVLVRALGGYRILALLFAFLTLTSGVVEVWPYPMHLAVFVLAIGVATAARRQSWPATLFVIGATLVVTAFLRPEFSFSFLFFLPVVLGWAIWDAVTKSGLWLRLRVALVFVLLVAAAGGLFAEFGNPLGAGRSFFAFGQHYSLNLWAKQRVTVDPWTNWQTLTQAAFGDADSIPQALRNNPREFLWHIHCNLSCIPGSINDLTNPRLALGVRPTRVAHWALYAFVAVGLVGLCRRLLRPSEATPADKQSLRSALLMLLFISAPTVASIVIIHPRPHYLLPLVTFSGALAFAGFSGFPRLLERVRWLENSRAVTGFAVLLVLVTPNPVHPWSVQQLLRPRPMLAEPLDVQHTVAVMRGLNVHSDQPISVLEADYSRAFYAGWDFHKIDHWTKTESFWQFLAAHNISVVVLDQRLLTDTRFRDDPEFLDFADEKKIGNYHFFQVPDTKVRIAVREDILPPAAAHAMKE